jgi:hypothetical protein
MSSCHHPTGQPMSGKYNGQSRHSIWSLSSLSALSSRGPDRDRQHQPCRPAAAAHLGRGPDRSRDGEAVIR